MSAPDPLTAVAAGPPGKLLEGFGISAQQRHLWRLMRAGGRGSAYLAGCSIRIDGPLDTELLARALAGLIGRHEILRTTFSCMPGIPLPVQVIHAAAGPALPTIDLAALGAAARELALAALPESLSRLPRDLERGPLLRLALAVLSPGRHELLMELPALCADTPSLRQLAGELAAGYELALAGGRHSASAADEPLQYADFCQWQAELLEAAETAAAQSYWQEQAELALRAVALPEERPGGPAPFVPRAVEVPVAAPLAAALDALARAWQQPRAAILLASWQVLLWRATGETELAVGVLEDGRRYAELALAVGLFARALPVAARLAEEMPFPALVAQAQTALREAGERQDLFSWQDLAPAAAAEPFAAFAFEWDEGSAADRRGSPTAFSIARPHASTDRFLLRLSAAPAAAVSPGGPPGLALAIGYDAGRLARGTAQRLAGQMLRLLESIRRHPTAALADLAFLGEGERHRLLVETAGPALDYGRGRCIHQLIEAQVERSPGALAVAAGDERLTYRELDRRAGRLARRLRALGVGPESRVGLCAGRTAGAVVGIYGILKAGGAYLPLDPDSPPARLTAILGDAGVELVLCEERLASRLAGQPARLLALAEPANGGPPDTGAPAAAAPENLAYVLYTSGSTGTPKGVMVAHQSVVASTAARLAGYPERVAAFYLASAFTFDSSVAGIFWTLCQGGALHLPPDGFQLDPERLAATLARDGISHLVCLPALYDLLLRHGEAAHFAALRCVTVAGETCPRELVGRHLRRLPEVPLHNEYGPTEATVWSSVHRCGPGDDGGLVPIGRAIANARLYLLDGALQPVAAGVPGELSIAGPGLARGYLGAPDATAVRFLPDAAGGRGERLYRTGDLARWRPDGRLEFLGRRDRQVKVRGFRIEPAEVEAALAGYPGVRAAAVAAREDSPGEPRLVAYLEADEPAPALEELRAYLRGRLPEPMVPALFVVVARLPRTASGKLDRGALPAPDPARPQLARDFVAPRSPQEELLAGIWAEVLRLPRVGIEDSFFALGGDSISAVRVRVKAQQSGLSFSVQQLFAHPTIAALAGLLAARDAAAAGDAAPDREAVRAVPPFDLVAPEDLLRLPAGAEDAYPLTMLQLGMLLHGELGREDAVYHDVVSITVTAPWDRRALAGALRQLAALHPVLRTSFHLAAFSEPIQIVHRDAAVPLTVVDLTGLPAGRREPAVAAGLEDEKRRPLDRELAPLLRVAVHLLGSASFRFGMAQHHAILDGWSAATLLAELFASYMERIAGRQPTVPAAPAAGLREYVALERQALACEATRSFWAERLAGAEPKRFPRWASGDVRRGPAAASPFHQRQVPIDAELSARLHRLATTLQVPIKSVLLAAHLRSLAAASGRRDLITGLMAHGRPEAEGSERALGLFLNALPLRFRLDGGSWSELVRQSFAAEQELLPHRRYPFARLQQTHGHGRQPLLETAFNFVHFHLLAGLRAGPGVELRAGHAHERTNFPLATHASLGVADSRVGVVLLAEGGEIGGAQLQALAGIYARTLLAMVDDPRARYETAPLLSAAESHQLMVEWNDTRAEPPAGLTPVHRLVESRALLAPERAAVVQGGETMSYGELARRSGELAARLRQQGAGPGACVGVCLPPSPALLVALLAVLAAGSAYVPLDPAGPPARLAFQLADARVRLVLTRRELAAGLPAAAAKVICLDDDSPTGTAPAVAPGVRVAPESPAYVLYTSGSTGTPKGVMVTHRNLAASTAARLASYPRPIERWLLLVPFTFDGSLAPIFATLSTGGALYLPQPGVERDPARIAQAISRHRITHLLSLPCWYEQILAAPAGQLATLTTCLVAGEPCPPGLPARHRALLPGCELVNEYGPTEATIWSTFHRARAFPAAATVPIGRPIPNARVLLLDEHLAAVPIGAPGEIWIGGAGIAMGYVHRPDLTADRFRPDPFASPATAGERLLCSGDLGRRRPDGEIEYLGRRDHQVKVRGFRIELGEIESALAEHPAVARAAAMVRGPAGSPQERRLVACFAASRAPAPTAAELREFLRPRLPAYMLPASFIQLAAMPLTAAGKIDRAALGGVAEPADGPERDAGQVGRPAAGAPRDSVELQLVQLWEEALGVRPIGVTDDFFDLGGHSLLGISLVSRIESRFGVALPLTALFEAPTIARLAGLLRRPAGMPSPSPLVPLQPAGTRPPLFCVHPSTGSVLCYLELARRLGPDQPVYGVESPALRAAPAAPGTLAALAAGYVAAVRRLQAHGPYLLAGWSAGGVIAFEMAVQLAAAGERVAELILLDSWAPSPSTADLDEAEVAARFGVELVGRRLGALPLSYEEFRRLDAGERVRRIVAAAESAGVLAAEGGEEGIQRLLHAFDDTIRRLASYAPTGYSGRLTLLRAEVPAADGDTDPTLGWGALASRGVEVVGVPGDHHSLLEPSGVDLVADQMRRCLQRCGAGREGA